MAIFVASTKSISRGKGQSAVASASYRAGVKLEDKRYGKTHDYSKRYGVMSEKIILPTHLQGENVKVDREDIWNKAETAENRKDARVAREWLFNLPYELSEEEREQLAHEISQLLADRYGVIADCAIHQPTQKEIDRGADPRNFHAHVMLTTRKVELDKNNEIVLKDKSTAELSDKKRRSLGLERMSEEVKEVRQLWEEVANKKLAEHNLKIDSRSYKDRGLNIEPQLKMGAVATQIERRKYEKELEKAEQAKANNEHYEIDRTPVTNAGLINQIINERNELVFNRELRFKREQENDRLIKRATGFTDTAEQNINSTAKRIIANKRQIENAKQEIDRRNKSGGESENEITRRADRPSGATGTERVSRAVTNSERAVNDSKQAVIASEQTITTRVTERPNPFAQRRTKSSDRRERSSSIFVEQKRRLDSETRRADKDAYFYKQTDKRRFETVELIKRQLANKLLSRKINKDLELRTAWGETSEQYPDKFDPRQMTILDSFEKSLNLSFDEYELYPNKLKHISGLMTADFIEKNKDMLKLLKDPQAEREQYNERLTAFNEFKESLDQEREQLHEQLKQQLGYGYEVGRMTRETLTSVDYLQKLDNFINDDSQNADARQLAEKHKEDTLGKTCEQFRLSYYDVLKLRDNNERVNYANALNSSLERFQQVYGSELSEKQNKDINSGLYSFERDVQQIQSQSRGLSR